MPSSNIVLIGAGSASFGPATLATLLRSRMLRGSCLSLVDTNGRSLENVAKVAWRMNEAWGAEMAITATVDRRDVLEGAEYVVVSVEVPPREVLWRMDWEIPLKHGLRQPYGENGGPGGLMHALRQIPEFIAIANDMEELCPSAWLINFSNPLPRITRALTKYTGIKVVGKCHQLDVGYGIAAVLLAKRLGLAMPEKVDLHSDPANIASTHHIADVGRQHLDIKAGGLNHFTWILDIREKRSGQDLYPDLRNSVSSAPAEFEPLGMELFRTFGLCPVPGDSHLCEYLPWTHDPSARPWERFNLRLYDWGGNESLRKEGQELLTRIADGVEPVDQLRDVRSEGAAELIEALSANKNYYDETVNIPNQGAISNLPDETIVEVPAIVSGAGVQGLRLGEMPAPSAELCRREAALVEMVADTAVSGDRSLALQALLMDPMINDIDRARAILDDYLLSFADYLPQFKLSADL